MIADWLAERSGFEPAVPILELLDDSSREGFQNWSTSRPISKRATFSDEVFIDPSFGVPPSASSSPPTTAFCPPR